MSSEKSRLGDVAKRLFSAEVPERAEREVIGERKTENDAWGDALRIARREPRVSFVRLKAKAILVYLRKTTPEFNISKMTAEIVEEAVKGKYPELWKLIE
jgi:hypothetical protein